MRIHLFIVRLPWKWVGEIGYVYFFHINSTVMDGVDFYLNMKGSSLYTGFRPFEGITLVRNSFL